MKELERKTKEYYIDCTLDRNIPYYEYVQQINNQYFRKYFIVDLRTLDSKVVDYLLDNFDDFQRSFIEDEFFSENRYINKCGLFLYFLCDEKIKFDWRTEKIKYNMQYAYKDFVIEKELDIILQRTINRTVETREDKIHFKNQDIQLDNFNLLYGGNGSGKTMLLKEIAKQFNIEMYSMLDSTIYFPNFLDEYRLYLQTILGNCHNKEEYFERLIGIIGNARKHHLPILIDDIGSCRLDDLNQLKEMDILADASYDNLTVIASCKSEIESLVRARVYKPNIIEMENFVE